MQTTQYGSFTAIPRKNAKNAADTVNWIAEKVKNQEYINIGKEGVHFTWDSDGYPQPIQPAFTEERQQTHQLMNFADMETYQKQFVARLKKNDMIWKAYTITSLDVLEKEPEIFVPAYFAYCNATDYVENSTALLKSVNDYISLLVVGQRTIEKNGASFTSDFKNQGGEEARAALQKWYDENYK